MSVGSELYRAHNLFQAGQNQYYPLYVPGGKTFYVAPSTYTAVGGVAASDGNDGESPQTPLATISQAHTNCVAGRHDTICLIGGTHTPSSAVTISKNYVRVVSMVPYAATIAGPGIIVDADGVEFAGLRFTDTASTNALKFADSTDTTGGHVHHCKFIGAADASAVGIVVGENSSGNDAAEVIIENCYFTEWNGGAVTIFGSYCQFKDNFIKAPTGSTCMTLGDYGTAAAVGNRDGLVIADCRFLGASTACTSLGVTIAGAEGNTGLYVLEGCFFGHLGDNSNDGVTTADRHPEGIGINYYGTAGDTDPDIVAG